MRSLTEVNATGFWRRLLVAALGLAAMTTVAACGSAGTDNSNDVGRNSNDGGVGIDESGKMTFSEVSHPVKEPPASLVDAAKGEGKLVWYESADPDDGNEILQAFQAEYPFVEDVEFVSLSSSDIGARVQQESSANAETADVVGIAESTISALNDAGFIEAEDWVSLGVPEELVPENFLVLSAAARFVIAYNTDLVPEDQAPTEWEDLTEDRFKDKVEGWTKPLGLSQLAPAWGVDEVVTFAEELSENGYTAVQSPTEVVNRIASGQTPVGITLSHLAQPAIDDGAPVKMADPSVVPMSLIYNAVTSSGANPNTAKLFIMWLNSEEGASLYEELSYRGNPLLPSTDTARALEGANVSSFSPSGTETRDSLVEDLSAIVN